MDEPRLFNDVRRGLPIVGRPAHAWKGMVASHCCTFCSAAQVEGAAVEELRVGGRRKGEAGARDRPPASVPARL